MAAAYKLTGSTTIVRTADGASIPPDPANRDYAAFLAWKTAGGVPDPYVAPPEAAPFLAPPQMVAAALDMIITPENYDISSVGGMFNIIGAMYLDVGVYWMFFAVPQPDANYYAVITGPTGNVKMTDHDASFFAIESTDAPGGTPIDPATINVQIYRIAT